MNIKTIFEEEEFNSTYIKASIVGPLAEEKSKLVKKLIDFWKQNNLLLINDVIKDDQEVGYVEGSIKTEAFKIFLDEHLKYSSILFEKEINRQPKDIKDIVLGKKDLNELKKMFMVAAKAQFPVKIIKEE